MSIARVLLLLLLPALGCGEEEAEVICAGTACYTLHRAELGWNAAQERCRHNGGSLAPVRSPAEARSLQELLEAAGWPGPAWIGLWLSRGRCVQPQEPLRGFSWAGGGEAGNYTAWVSEPAVTCLSSRCVSLQPHGPSGPGLWADRPCRGPLPAFLCKFIFRGMCGPLPLLGPGRVSYTTPFGVRSPRLAAAPFGTLAEAACQEESASSSFSLCKGPLEDGGFAWDPPGPFCPATCSHRNGGCQHRCLEEPGGPRRCDCHPGYTLAPDMASCLPRDACHPNPCPGTCRTLPDGFQCGCGEGYTLAGDGRTCLDVDECLAGPCQHQCQNTLGSFLCLCRPGYRPAGPGSHQCRDEDECARPDACPQLCLNLPGSFRCACRHGYHRSGDSCLDVDECLRDPCPGPCRNFPGGFECLCPPGLLPQEDGRGCRAAPTAGEEPAGHPSSPPGSPRTTGILQTLGAPRTTGVPQSLGIPFGVTPTAPAAAGSVPGPEHSADGPRLLLYYILGSLVAILLLLAFALALLACKRRAAKRQKRAAKNAADSYCWVPEQPESRGVGGERSGWEKQ